MPSITFRGAVISFAKILFDSKSKSLFTRINFAATYSKPVREEMNWAEVPEGVPDMPLETELICKQFTMKPPSGLDNHAFSLECNSIGSFHVYRIGNDDPKKKPEYEIRFQIFTSDDSAPSRIAKYLKVIGEGEGQLLVKYEAQSELENEADKQGALPGASADQEPEATSEEAPGPALVGAGGRRGPRSKPN